MDMNIHEILKESAKKLLALKISDDEIVANLRDIGVSPREARQILNETKKELPAAKRAELKQPAPSAMDELKKAIEGNDTAAIESASQQLQQASHKLAEAMYAAAAQEQQAAGGDGSGQPGGEAGAEAAGGADDTVDADYTVVEDDDAEKK